jgi:HNH endonuclease
MSQNKLLSEYQAAAIVGLSPWLLRWFTKYAPKQGDSRKLKVAEKDKDVIFFEEPELLSFNEWLKLPWPHASSERPPIPTGIRQEIKAEANGQCAICQSHGSTCQAAHLDPVAKSKNNHPENLLWLCANHHVAYDDGLFGPDAENREFVGKCQSKHTVDRLNPQPA